VRVGLAHVLEDSLRFLVGLVAFFEAAHLLQHIGPQVQAVEVEDSELGYAGEVIQQIPPDGNRLAKVLLGLLQSAGFLQQFADL